MDIQTGGELIIGNPLDFSVTESLIFDNPANSRTSFRTLGSIKVYGEVTLECTQSTNYAGINYIYTGGELILSGSHEHPVRCNNLAQIRYSEASTGSYTYTHFGKVAKSTADPTMYCYNVADVKLSATNCAYGINSGSATYQSSWPVYLGPTIVDWKSHIVEFNNCEVHNLYYGPNFYALRSFKMVSGSVSNYPGSSYNGVTNNPTNVYFYQWFKDVHFNDDDGIYYGYLFNHSETSDFRLLFEHCYFDFLPTSRLIYWTPSGDTPARKMLIDPQFASASYEKYGPYPVEFVNRLTINVTDVNNNPLSGVLIGMSQVDGYEEWTQETGADGYLDLFGQTALFCTHYLKSGDYPSFTYDYKSDDSNGTYHQIIATKVGYGTILENIVMDGNKSLTLKMQPSYTPHINYSKYSEIL